MKKYLTVAVAFFVMSVLILSGCGTTSNKSSNTNGSSSGSSNTSTSSSSTQTLKPLKVVTNGAYAPFEYLDKGQLVGFDIDFLNAVAKDAGFKLNFQNVGWDAVFASLQGHDADLAISAITINSDRKQTYDFSVPYFLSTNEIMVKKSSNISSSSDLTGKTIAVQNGTTGQAVAEKILGKNSPKVKKFPQNTTAIQDLLHGGSDAVIADSGVIESYVKSNSNQNLKIINDPSFPTEYYGVMFPKGSPYEAAFNKAIKQVFNDGTYTKIYSKYFSQAPNIKKVEAEQAKAQQ